MSPGIKLLPGPILIHIASLAHNELNARHFSYEHNLSSKTLSEIIFCICLTTKITIYLWLITRHRVSDIPLSNPTSQQDFTTAANITLRPTYSESKQYWMTLISSIIVFWFVIRYGLWWHDSKPRRVLLAIIGCNQQLPANNIHDDKHASFEYDAVHMHFTRSLLHENRKLISKERQFWLIILK